MSKLQYLNPAKNEYSYFIKNIFLEIAWYPLRQVQTLPLPYPKHLFFSLFIFWRTTERRRKFKTPIFSSRLPTLHDLPASIPPPPTKGWLTVEIAATTHAYYAHIHFGKKSSIRSRFSKCSRGGGGGYDIGGLEKWHLLPFPRHAPSSSPSSSSSSFYRKPLFPTFVTCFWAGETVLVHIMATKIKRIEMKNLQTQQFEQKSFLKAYRDKK